MIKNIGRTKITLISGFIGVVIVGSLLYVYHRQSVSKKGNSTEIKNTEASPKEGAPILDLSSAKSTIKRSTTVLTNLSDKGDPSPPQADKEEPQSPSFPLDKVEDPQAPSSSQIDKEKIRAFPILRVDKENSPILKLIEKPLAVAKRATLSNANNAPSKLDVDEKSVTKDKAENGKVSLTKSEGESDETDQQNSNDCHEFSPVLLETVMYYGQAYDDPAIRALLNDEKDREAVYIPSRTLNASDTPITPIPALPPLESPGLVKAADQQLKKQFSPSSVTTRPSESPIKSTAKLSDGAEPEDAAKNEPEPEVIIKAEPEDSTAKAASDPIIDTIDKKEPSTAPANEKDLLLSTPGMKKYPSVPNVSTDESLVSAAVKVDTSTASAPLEDTLPDGTFKDELSTSSTPQENASPKDIAEKAFMNALNTSISVLDSISETSKDIESPPMPIPVRVVDYSSENTEPTKKEEDSSSPVELKSSEEIPLV